MEHHKAMTVLPIRQRGISLLSLLVASAIGIFVSGAALKVYVNSKQAFNTRNVLAEVVENQRFSLDDMRRILVMAGRDIRGVEDDDKDWRTFPPVTTASSATDKGAEFIYDGGTASDVVAIRYRRGPSCGQYQNITSLAIRPSMVRFYITDNDGDGISEELVCELKTYDSDGVCDASAPCRTTIASGAKLFKVLYGIDEDDDGYADRYLSAIEIKILGEPSAGGAPAKMSSPWSRIVTLRLGLVMGSETELPASARKETPETIKIFGMDFTEPDTSHLYRVATTTLSLRNFSPIVERQ